MIYLTFLAALCKATREFSQRIVSNSICAGFVIQREIFLNGNSSLKLDMSSKTVLNRYVTNRL